METWTDASYIDRQLRVFQSLKAKEPEPEPELELELHVSCQEPVSLSTVRCRQLERFIVPSKAHPELVFAISDKTQPTCFQNARIFVTLPAFFSPVKMNCLYLGQLNFTKEVAFFFFAFSSMSTSTRLLIYL